MKLLLAKDDVDVNVKDNSGQIPLLMAASNGYDTMMKLLLARSDIDSNSKDIHGRASLSLAASNGHKTVVNLLLARSDIDPNSKDINSRTALSMAALNWHGEVIESLLAHDNVIPDSQDDFGLTPLHLAVAQDREQPFGIIRPLVNKGRKLTALVDYQYQLMLLEQLNKKRVSMARLYGGNMHKGSSMLEAVKKCSKIRTLIST